MRNSLGLTSTVSEFMSSYWGYEEGMVWWCVAILAAYIVAFRAGAVLLLRYARFLKR